MIINFISWIPIFSFIAISLLYLLRRYTYGSLTKRLHIEILLLPSLISSIYIFKLTYIDGVIIIKLIKIMMIPISLGVQFSYLNSLIIVSLNFLILLLVFFSPQTKTAKNVSLASMIAIFVYIISISPDQLIKITAFSMGSMLFTFIFLNEEKDKNIISIIIKEFFFHRICDFLALIALMIILIKKGNLIVTELIPLKNGLDSLPKILYLLFIILNSISLILPDQKQQMPSYASMRYLIFRKLFIGAGTQILLLQFAPVLLNNYNEVLFFIIANAIIFLIVLFLLIFYKENYKLQNQLFNILMFIGLVATCLGYTMVTLSMIFGILVIYPIATLSINIRSHAMLYPTPVSKFALPFTFPSIFTKVVFQFPINVFSFLIKIFSDYFNLIYSSFLFYRIPQIIIGIIQIPLRLFNNGNIQRSLIFAALVLVGYFYWWKQQ